MTNERHDRATIERALRLLRRGDATPAEIAKLAKASLQLVRYWAARDNVDWKAARADRLKRLWQA